MSDDYEVDDLLTLLCEHCGHKVREHLLVNDREEVVWPPPKAWIQRRPVERPRKRSRRTVPLEADPEPFKVTY